MKIEISNIKFKGVDKSGCLSPMPTYHEFQLIEFLRACKNDFRVPERLK